MEKRSWIIVVGIAALLIVLLILIPIVLRQAVSQVVGQALSPFEQSSQQIQTQVSNLLHPTPTVLPDPVTIIREVRGMAQLVTVQYTLEKIITAEIGQGAFGFLVGDKILFIAHGYVRAGVDLEELDPEDIRVDGGVVYVQLPEPEILVATLDNDQSYVYDREMGFLTKGDPNLETTARRAAEDEIEKAAIEDGILDLARQNAEVFLMGFIRNLGFDDIVFE